VIGKTAAYFYRNKEHYADFLKFNFNGAVCDAEPVTTVSYRNVPIEESERLKKLYKHFGFVEESAIFQRLGTVPTKLNLSCPIEAKWVYEYVKKFKTKKYSACNIVLNSEIMTKLPATELSAYILITE
jgi:hypothetical protein